MFVQSPGFHLLLAQQQEQECTVSLCLSAHNLPRNSMNISKLRDSSQKQYGQMALVSAQSTVDISYFHVTTLMQVRFICLELAIRRQYEHSNSNKLKQSTQLTFSK